MELVPATLGGVEGNSWSALGVVSLVNLDVVAELRVLESGYHDLFSGTSVIAALITVGGALSNVGGGRPNGGTRLGVLVLLLKLHLILLLEDVGIDAS